MAAPPWRRVGEPSLPAQRVAVTAVFFVLGAGAASWAARLPAIKGDLHLSAGALGVALLGAPAGAVIAMPVTGTLLGRVSPRHIVPLAFVPFAALLPALSVAADTAELFAVLLGWGLGLGAVDVAMNTEAASVQARLGRRVMSRFHAAYSVGGLVGAGAGALAATFDVGVGVNLLAAGIVVGVVGIAAAGAFSRPSSRPVPRPAPAPAATALPPTGAARGPGPRLVLAALAAVAFGCFLAEGAANDWSAVYLHSSLGAPPGLAAAAYTAFAGAMAAGRLAGDHLADRLGPVRLVRLAGATAAVGFGAALAAGRIGAALAGFVLLGLGLSSIVPLAFTAAAQLGRAGRSLATVSSVGYIGTLVGPAFIGGLAEVVGLPGALVTIVVVSAAATFFAGAVRPRRGSPVLAGT
jgi:MFS family permease